MGTLLNVIFVLIYIFWKIIAAILSFIWKLIMDVLRGVYGKVVQLLSGLVFLGLVGLIISLLHR